jgi:hypothetical protein
VAAQTARGRAEEKEEPEERRRPPHPASVPATGRARKSLF